MKIETLSYPYKPNPWMMLFASFFFGTCAYFMAQEALTNDRGLIVNGVVHFSRHWATIFYWCIAAISGAFVVVGISALFVGLLSTHRVTLTATDISAPKYGFSRNLTVVALTEIASMDIRVIQRKRFLDIHHHSGVLTLTEFFLPNKASFDALCSAIASRAPSLSRS